MKKIILLCLCAVYLNANAATLEQMESAINNHTDAFNYQAQKKLEVYNKIYPSNFLMCGSTKIQGKNQPPAGGDTGHAVLFFKSLCLDRSHIVPRVKFCKNGPGVGVSVNRDLKNANWVGIPTWKLFMNGGLELNQPLTKDYQDQLVKNIVGYYHGIKLHPPGEKSTADDKAGPEAEKEIATQGLGSDYALRFGRSMFCVAFPASEVMIQRGMNYLNALNAKYERDESYRWDMNKNNCSDLVHNTLAAMGIWKSRRTNSVTLISELTNLSIPSNDVSDTMLKANAFIADPLFAYQHSYLRDLVRISHRFPSSEGVMLHILPYHSYKNDLYVSAGFLQPMDVRFVIQGSSEKLREVVQDPVDTNIRAHLNHFLEIYKQAAANPKTVPEYILKFPPFMPIRSSIVLSDDFRTFLQEYYETLNERIREVEKTLAVLE